MLLAAVVLLGIGLRLSGRAVHSLWFDEACTVQLALAEDLDAALRKDRQPPLSLMLFRGWMALGGRDDSWLRLLPALASSLALCLFALLARRWVPSRALFATALFAIAPFSLWFAHEIRAYAFLGLAAVLGLLAAALVIEDERRRGFAALLAALSASLAFGSHYCGSYGVAALLSLLFLARWQGALSWRSVLFVSAGALIGVLVWLPWMATNLPAQLANEWGSTTTLSAQGLVELPIRQILTKLSVLPEASVPFVYLGSLLLLVLLACFALRCAQQRRGPARLVAVALLVPYLVGLLIALLLNPSFTPRYLMSAAPAVVLALALGLDSVRPRFVRWGFALFLLALCCYTSAVHRRENFREDYRGVCAELAREWRPNERIFSVTGTYDDHARAPLLHYLRVDPELLAAVGSLKAELGSECPRKRSGRVHVIYRESPYAKEDLDRLAKLTTLEYRGPSRLRIRHLILRWNESR